MQKHIIGNISFSKVKFHLISIAKHSRATCYMQILKFQAAVADFKKVLALEPKNDLVRSQMVSTQKLIRKIEFEKASIWIFSMIVANASIVGY